MSTPAKWLHIVGIGDDGLASLAPATLSIVQSADVIIGADRHHELTKNLDGKDRAERLSWPSPFDALIKTLETLRGKQVVVLATGDPLWHSVGVTIAKHFDMSDLLFHPQLSAFQLASARMGWNLANTETLTVHGRPAEKVLPFFAPDQKLILLTADGQAPVEIAALLTAQGYSRSKLTVLAHMGGAGEARFEGVALDWSHRSDMTVPDFHALAVECIADDGAVLLPRTGLPDAAFVSDGTMTKRDIRAVTLAKLNPMRGALLWDVGCGSGTVAIEWMRAAKDTRAIGIERRADRRAMAAENALALGAPQLKLIDADLPKGMTDLPAPDAVFIGGGLSHETFQTAWSVLKPHGRLVINTVTLEGETILFDLHKVQGGDLVKIAVTQALPVGSLTAWRPSMPVTQLSLTKRGAQT
jgi:precorrin-6Y C5,15-methyltransferase (decarboxylating)